MLFLIPYRSAARIQLTLTDALVTLAEPDDAETMQALLGRTDWARERGFIEFRNFWTYRLDFAQLGS
jgi:hypothetical protein